MHGLRHTQKPKRLRLILYEMKCVTTCIDPSSKHYISTSEEPSIFSANLEYHFNISVPFDQ